MICDEGYPVIRCFFKLTIMLDQRIRNIMIESFHEMILQHFRQEKSHRIFIVFCLFYILHFTIADSSQIQIFAFFTFSSIPYAPFRHSSQSCFLLRALFNLDKNWQSSTVNNITFFTCLQGLCLYIILNPNLNFQKLSAFLTLPKKSQK